GGGSNSPDQRLQQDVLTMEDLRAIREQVAGIKAASPMVELHDRVPIGGGKEREILVLGVDHEYQTVRNLLVVAGRFYDPEDTMARNKVAAVTVDFAKKAVGSAGAAVGKTIKIHSLPFVIVGVFKERVE